MNASVMVKKEELIAAIKSNLAKHREIFEEALEGFRVKAVNHFNAQIDNIREGRDIEYMLPVQRPTDHTKDYQRALRMLEMDVNEHTELDEETFAQLVDDDWGWKAAFLSNATQMTGKFYR